MECVSPEGDIIDKQYVLDDFSDVTINCSADLILTQSEDASPTVIVETEENIQELLKLKVVNNELVIDMEGCIFNSNGVTVYVSLPHISGLTINGSGDMSTDGEFKQTENIDLSVEGSGDMKLQLDATKINATIDGSGDIKLTGKADHLMASIDGSGDIKAYKCKSKETTAKIDGSGDIEVTVKKNLKVSINGSGDVKYKGSPKVESSIDGSGDVKKN
jgi:hypothetical protein